MIYRTFLILLILPLLGAGCVRLKASTSSQGGVFRSANAAEDWESRSFVKQEGKKRITIGGTNVTTIHFDPTNPSIMVIGTDNDGMFRTENGGEQWTPLSFQNGNFSELDLHPTETQTMIATSGNIIFRSGDQGQTWANVYTETTQVPIADVKFDLYDANRIFALLANGVFLMSNDNGVNWEVIHRLNVGVIEMVINPRDTRIIYIQSEKEGVFKSTDQGKAWSNISREPLKIYPGSNVVFDLKLLPSRPNTLYLATAYGLFVTTDGGFAFTPVKTLLPPKTAVHRVAVDATNPSTLYFTVGRILHKSTDAGETWKVIENFPSDRFIQVFEAHPNNADIVYAGIMKPKK